MGEGRIEVERQRHPQEVRNNDARVADHDRGLDLPFQLGNIELHPDREHEKTDPDLTEKLKWDKGGRGEEKLNAWGASQPKSDGPSRIPAIISPTTAGWPTRVNNPPITEAARIIMNS